MSEFSKIFSEAEKALEFLKTEHSFSESERYINDAKGSQAVVGSVTYSGRPGKNGQRIIVLSTAPLRLELDLDVGFSQRWQGRNVFNL